MGETIKRRVRRERFTTVNNEYLQDVNLSWKAKGLITYIMSLPSDWVLNVQDLKNRSKDRRDATAAGLRELIENGYCQRTEVRNTDGTFNGYSYEVSDLKEFAEKPCADNPKTENPCAGNPKLINTNNTKNSTKHSNECVGSQTLFAPEPTSDRSKKTLFRNSEIAALVVERNGQLDYSAFEGLFVAPEFAQVDLVYYFHTVADWSDSSNTKRTKNGWIATVRNFIRGDISKSRVHLKPEYQPSNGAIDIHDAMAYLNDPELNV